MADGDAERHAADREESPRVAGDVIRLLLGRQLVLALVALDRAIGIHDEREVEDPGGARPLHRRDHGDAMLPREVADRPQRLLLRGLIVRRRVREIGAVAGQERFGEADDRRAALGGLGQEAPHRGEPCFARRGRSRRRQPDPQTLRHHPLPSALPFVRRFAIVAVF